jgi:capsular polysaccharide biosynthesis protein
MLAKYGISTIYAEYLTLSQQQKVFEKTRYLVALQGMGLIQQFFMNNSESSVIEIMPANRLQSEYYWQAYVLGTHYYDVLVGTELNKDGYYNIDLSNLEIAIKKMLDYDSVEKKYGRVSITNSNI